jgi:5-formyltetrahydrofolate cyclo-ligase
MNKSAIRQIYKLKRLELTTNEVQEKSKIIAENFIKNLLPKISGFSDKKLAFYIAANNEVDPIFIIKHCQDLGNIIALPKIVPNSLILDFKSYKIGDKLYPNHIYPKLFEPEKQNQTIIADIIFVPLVAFDKNCNRIGMGGGFYDATINYYKKNLWQNHKQTHHQTFIGLAYDWQNFSEIPQETSDQNLNYIVCEKNIISRS